VSWSIDFGGDYFRLLVDGSYKIQVESPGYEIETQYVTVHNEPMQYNAQRLDFILQPVTSKRMNFQQMLTRFFNLVRKFVFSLRLKYFLGFSISYWYYKTKEIIHYSVNVQNGTVSSIMASDLHFK
jgi:hypothetical protein